jgi:hypothetical protein
MVRIVLQRNDGKPPKKTVVFDENKGLDGLLALAKEKLQLEATRAFVLGGELDDADALQDNDVVIFTTGEEVEEEKSGSASPIILLIQPIKRRKGNGNDRFIESESSTLHHSEILHLLLTRCFVLSLLGSD